MLTGIALFLFGMSLMGEGIKNVAGGKLESLLWKVSGTPVKGVLMGTVVTSIIQSSSATTIMMVGFVNAGIMQVFQAIGVIMGANIGTSITGWILCLSYLGSDKSGLVQLFSTATLTAVVGTHRYRSSDVWQKIHQQTCGRHHAWLFGFAFRYAGHEFLGRAVEAE